MTVFHLNLAGQIWDVPVSSEVIDLIHLPLLKRLSVMANEKGRRFVVLLAAPPGAGKTTTAALWENFPASDSTLVTVQALPMDGFHFPNSLLDKRTIVIDREKVSLRKIKGAPESYDLKEFKHKLKALYYGESLMWPVYDRITHDPIPDAIEVIDSGIIVIEGNYLLLDEPGWRDLKEMADFTIFIECHIEDVRELMIMRAMRGGKSRNEAISHFEYNDRRNFERVLTRRVTADINLSRSEMLDDMKL